MQGPVDELVDERELDGRQARPSRLQGSSNVDFVTITHNRTRTGNNAVRVRVEPYLPQREIRLRSSTARELAEGANARLKLEQDRLTTGGSPIRDATLEFAADLDEADGLPAVVRINDRTSLFNFDYARLDNSTRPLLARLKNAMDPETGRCAVELPLGLGAEDFRDRYVLLGTGFGDCNRTANSRDGELVFADSVPPHLRLELRGILDGVAGGMPENDPRTVFVAWRPQSTQNDFRLVRSLAGTSVLLLNGPAWGQQITEDQREALGTIE